MSEEKRRAGAGREPSPRREPARPHEAPSRSTPVPDDPVPGGGSDLGDPEPDAALVEALVKEIDEQGRSRAADLKCRVADARLVAELRGHGFEGPLYQQVEDELARYALAVLSAWICSGWVFAMTGTLGMRIRPGEAEMAELRRDADARLSLAGDAVATTLPRFRQRALIGGDWTFEGGASLSTYFVGAVLYSFPNAFRRWRKERHRHPQETLCADPTEPGSCLLPAATSPDPAVEVAACDALRRRFARITDERARAIVYLVNEGFSQAEIADMLSLDSARVIEGVIYRWRQTERRHGRGAAE